MNRGLYPSVAVSDAFNVAGNLIGVSVAIEGGQPLAALGFFTVALAGFVGVLRFGFNETKFADANGALADFAGFVGLPCVGLTFLRNVLRLQDTAMIVLFGCVEAITRGMHPKSREMAKICTNLGFFVVPVAVVSFQRQNYVSLGGVLLFVFAGLVITADRHSYILGVRCENWFHYCIGVAAILISLGI